MSDRKIVLRSYTVADYEDAEIWLRAQHKRGWKLVKIVWPCFCIFESCTPADVVYRVDFKNRKKSGDYFQIVQDYGWEYFTHFNGWLFFRKPVSETDTEQDIELFSDDKSRLERISHFYRMRIPPLFLLFSFVILPNFSESGDIYASSPSTLTLIWRIFWMVMLLLYLFVFIRCGLKIRKLRKKYGKTL